MKPLVRLVLGIILIYAGISRQEIFYRIRGIPLKGIAAYVMRIIYITAGILLIIL
ncbi:MAG: hypothetical protein NC253_12720 [Ruminococcus sp.]|nr:hypothetical protein [Ruminococcus sp.]MCM1479947.1 hypothetical protein [Muribaculaceae bacterium]